MLEMYLLARKNVSKEKGLVSRRNLSTELLALFSGMFFEIVVSVIPCVDFLFPKCSILLTRSVLSLANCINKKCPLMKYIEETTCPCGDICEFI